MTTNHQEFSQDGYFTHKFETLSALQEIREICESMAKAAFPQQYTSLDNYHLIDIDSKAHDDFQYQVFTRLNDKKLHHQFVNQNLNFFISLFGPDIDIQTKTYIRIARPGKQLDNIGMHRDIDYGNSAYEISLSLPLINQKAGCGLSIIPKSHLFIDQKTQQLNREDVERGDTKNEMGFLYAPKRLTGIKKEQEKCICLPFGSGLGFTLGLIHGQEENTSNMTRWSIDFRIKNSFHPVNKNLKHDYYTRFNQGILTELAKKFYQVNPDEFNLLTNIVN